MKADMMGWNPDFDWESATEESKQHERAARAVALKARVEAFQARQGLTVDGVIGLKETWPRVENIETAYRDAEKKLGEALDDLASCEADEPPYEDLTPPSMEQFVVGGVIGAIAALILVWLF